MLRGPVAHFKLLYYEFTADKQMGIRTTGFKRSENSKEHHYQAAAYYVLFPLMKEVNQLCPHYKFYDIGSGMARVICVAELNGFSELIGIEIDKTLMEMAKRNIEHYSKVNPDSLFFLHCTNALDYDYGNEDSVYFLFNPFDADTLGKFIDRVCKLNSKTKCFVYMNPLFKEEFSARNISVFKAIKTNLYTEALIYYINSESSNSLT